ncbi:MAG TPA: DUF4350 domain-containing protein [Chloroflexota bacterium]
MRRLRSSLILLTLCVGALLASWLQLARDSTRLPAGSSYSYQTDGALALYLWAESIGASPARFREATLPSETPRTLLVLQPEQVITPAARREFEAVARQGGTLVLAGDSIALQLYARELQVPFEPAQIGSTALDQQGTSLPISSRFRLRYAGEALLTTPSGDALAIRQHYFDGSLVVIATPQPFTNNALRDSHVASFVYRTVLANATTIAFDEAHHSYTPPTESQPATVDGLLFDTAPGRAVVYVAVLTFLFLLLAGRRLGPPLAERGATEMRRTMYEHVQMLGSLYRRAGQLETVRTAFARHYHRIAARSVLAPARAALLEQSVSQVHNSRSEAELIAAVSAADRAVSAR